MKTENRFVMLFLMTVTLLLLAACGAPQPTATEPSIAMDTTAPRDTPLPTDTPVPTGTPLPTDTPMPTEPPAPPTETPALELEERTWPTKRESFAMVYHPQIERVLLFCGYDDFVNYLSWQPEMENMKARDEWSYDVSANRLEPWAVVRSVIYQQVLYDSQAESLISFGSSNTRVYDVETKTWEKTNPAKEPPTFNFWYALAHDSQSDRTIVHGGYFEDDETWAYDHQTNAWTEMTPAASPEGRWGHAMAYDAESDRIIMWGGHEREPVDLMSDEEHETIWAYDYETNTWMALESKDGPSYRHGHTMVYHPGTDRIILFGGHHAGDVYFSDETWAYDYNSSTWTQLDPANYPSGRRFHSMVYDEAADKMVLFGGIAGTWLKEEINDELWIFDPVAEEWSQVMPDTLNP
jgi:hypothetical protein